MPLRVEFDVLAPSNGDERVAVGQPEGVRGARYVEAIDQPAVDVELDEVAVAGRQGEDVAIVQHFVAAGAAAVHRHPLQLAPCFIQLDHFVIATESDHAAVTFQPWRPPNPDKSERTNRLARTPPRQRGLAFAAPTRLDKTQKTPHNTVGARTAQVVVRALSARDNGVLKPDVCRTDHE